jgi:hypothetical protein
MGLPYGRLLDASCLIYQTVFAGGLSLQQLLLLELELLPHFLPQDLSRRRLGDLVDKDHLPDLLVGDDLKQEHQRILVSNQMKNEQRTTVDAFLAASIDNQMY